MYHHCYVFNRNKSVSVEKYVNEKIVIFLTTKGALENKPNGNKNSFLLKNQAKFASNGTTENTPLSTEISNTPTKNQISHHFDENIIENSNSNHLPKIKEHDFLNLLTAQEQINTLKGR